MSLEAMKLMVEALEENEDLGMKTFEAIAAGRQAISEAEKQEPVAWACWLDSENPETDKPTVVNYEPLAYSKRRPLLYAHPPKRVVFPTMLRKMWSGAEVQAWLDEHLNK
jgi:hypothetical protein